MLCLRRSVVMVDLVIPGSEISRELDRGGGFGHTGQK